jgi:ABC-type bacteriocin/lantibiotic exporter with double-glycine peptidase domain
VQQNLLAWSSFLEEHISSILSVQLLSRERYQERKGFRLLGRTTRSYLALFNTGMWFTVSTSFAVVLAMVAVIGYGGWSVLAGTLSLGSLVAFYSFVTQLFEPFSGVAELYTRAQATFASIRQLHAMFALRPSVTNSLLCRDFPNQRWDVEFESVEFGYGPENTLQIPCLRIVAGERVAMTGENGAGKSTLARLIPRLYDIRAGSICIGGIDIRSIHLKSLRSAVGYLPRDPVLFDGTLALNLLFVRPEASEHEMRTAVNLAELDDLIGSMPAGLFRRIGPDGSQLSGGQRQRLAIARALLQRPQILVLDEATSCLDPSCEATILRNLFVHLPTTTIIVISHRASTIDVFGRVLTLAGGRIVSDHDQRHFRSVSK